MKYMGPSVQSTTKACRPNDQNLISFSSFNAGSSKAKPMKCKMECKKANDTTKYVAPKKAFMCVCKDGNDGKNRVCNWNHLDSNPAKGFDKKFWKAQNNDGDAKCMPEVTV